MSMRFANNASTKLADAITPETTTIFVYPGTGVEFPVIGNDKDYFHATIVGDDGNYEIVRVVAVDGDMFTVVRAQENTVAQEWQEGTRIENRITAEFLNPRPTMVIEVMPEDESEIESLKERLSDDAFLYVKNAGVVNAPVITSPAAYSTTDVFNGTLTVTAGTFSSTPAGDMHLKTDWRVTADAAGKETLAEAIFSDDLRQHTFTELDVKNDQTIYIWVRYRGMNYGLSSWGVRSTTCKIGYVDTPSILTPANNSTVYVTDGNITVTSSTFASTPTTDEHVSSDWKLTSDPAGNNIIAETSGSDELYQHTFAGVEIQDGATVYVWVRYNSKNYGSSDWASHAVITRYGMVNTPSIVTPLAGTEVYVINGELTATSSEFATTPNTDTHSSTDWKITSDISGNSVLAEDLNTKDLTQHTFTGLVVKDSQPVYIWVRYHGVEFGTSEWSQYRIVICRLGYVNAPSIVTPSEGANVYIGNNTIAVTSSAFATTPAGQDTHASSDWKLTSDAAGSVVIKEDAGSSDLTAHTFTGLSLQEGQTVYIWVRYNGAKFGASQWSAGRRCITKNGILTPSGRVIYRHANNKGSVIEFNMFGKAMKMFVADAQYRKKGLQFGAYDKHGGLNTFDYVGSNSIWAGSTYYIYNEGGVYQSGSNTQYYAGNDATLNPVTDAQLQERFHGLRSDKTAKENCNGWITYKGTTDSERIRGVPAVEHCRNQYFDGISACDLPNVYELLVIYVESDILDELDPTAASNMTLILSKMSNSRRWFGSDYIWASTGNSDSNAWYVGLGGYALTNGKGTSGVAVPVYELS